MFFLWVQAKSHCKHPKSAARQSEETPQEAPYAAISDPVSSISKEHSAVPHAKNRGNKVSASASIPPDYRAQGRIKGDKECESPS